MRPSWKTLFAAALIAALPLAAAQAESNRVVLVVDGTREIRNLPALVAESLGYFKAEGLLVTLTEIRDESPTDAMLADGRADGAVAFYHHTFMTQAAGMETESVITMGISPAVSVMVSNGLRDRVHGVADLKGMRIATGGLNSGKTTAANWIMQHAGLGAGDYRPVQPGTRDKMLAALKSGELDAIIAHEPDATVYERAGAAFRLADMTAPAETRQAFGNLFPSTALYMRNDYVRANPETVRHLVRAFALALQFINTHSADEIAAKISPEVFKRAGDFRFALERDKPMFATDGRTDPADSAALLQVMAALQPKYKAVALDRTYTNAFVEQALAAAH